MWLFNWFRKQKSETEDNGMKYSVHKINTAGNTALTSNNVDEVNNKLTNEQLFSQRMFAIMQPAMYMVMYLLSILVSIYDKK